MPLDLHNLHSFACHIKIMEVFKVPSNVPQDLQFIQDIIGELPPPAPVQKPSTPPPSTVSHDENIDSSDSDADSEKEVEADILTGIAEDEDDENGPVYVPIHEDL